LDKALLDTDTFSEVLKRVDAQVVTRATEYRLQFGVYTISTITVVEIVKGLHKVQREERLQEFLRGL
jgi:tRNA(fMet)-specific endonuclease VapC